MNSRGVFTIIYTQIGRFRFSLLEVLISFSISIVTLRVFLFQPGAYVYADQFWGVLPNLPNTEAPVLLISNLGGRVYISYLFQFTRDLISWPYLIVSSFLPYAEALRLFILLSFVGNLLLAWYFSSILVEVLLEGTKKVMSVRGKELFKFLVVILVFCNLFVINLNADGGTFSDSVIFLLTCISISLLFKKRNASAFLSIGVMLGVIVLLDPDYYPISILGLLIVSFSMVLLNHKKLSNFINVLKAILISIPFYLLVQIAILVLNGSFGAYRQISIPASLSNNLNPLFEWGLVGNSWTNITFVSPSILFSPGPIQDATALGQPTILLLLPGLLSLTWLGAVWSIPLISSFSPIFRSTRWITLPTAILMVLGILLSQYAHLGPLLTLLVYMGYIPYLGNSISTVFAIPDHLMMLIAISFIFLYSAFFFNILSIRTNESILSSNFAHIPFKGWKIYGFKVAKSMAIVLLVSIVIFSGWQAFDGSFYPARPDNSYFDGNGVVDIGGMAPVNLNNYTIQAYDYLFNNGSNFNVYWPIGGGIALNAYYIGSPSANVSELPFLLSHGYFYDVAPYLRSISIRYIVVQNQSMQYPQMYMPDIIHTNYNNNQFLYYFGLESYWQVLNALNSVPGVQLCFENPVLEIFKVMGSGNLFYNANIIINYTAAKDFVGPAIGSFSAMGLLPTIANDYGLNVSDNFSSETTLIPPNTYLNYFKITNGTKWHFFNNYSGLNNSDNVMINQPLNNSIDASWIQSHSNNQFNRAVQGYFVTDWGGEVNVSVVNGTFTLFSKNGSLSTIEYGGATTSDAPGIPVQNSTIPYAVKFSAVLSGNINPADSFLYIQSVGIGTNGQSTIFQQQNVFISSNSKEVNTSFILPSFTKYFTVRIGGDFHGEFTLSNYNITIMPLFVSSNLPFGVGMYLMNGTISLPLENSDVYIYLKGNGKLNTIYENLPSYTWYKLNSRWPILITGNFTIGDIMSFNGGGLAKYKSNYVQYNGGGSSILLLKSGIDIYKPIVVENSYNIYNVGNSSNRTYEVISPLAEWFEAAYFAIVGYIAIIFFIIQRRKNHEL